MSDEKIKFSLYDRLSAELENFLDEKYGNSVDILKFDKNNRDLYLNELNARLLDVSDLFFCNFILPNGKLKRLNFDLSEFVIKDIYRVKLGINENNLALHCNVGHKTIRYLGFELEDVLKAGCIQKSGYHTLRKEIVIYYDPCYYFPNSIMMDIVEETLMQVDNVCISCKDNLKNQEYFKFFSKNNGDTIKDIKRMMNETLVDLKLA